MPRRGCVFWALLLTVHILTWMATGGGLKPVRWDARDAAVLALSVEFGLKPSRARALLAEESDAETAALPMPTAEPTTSAAPDSAPGATHSPSPSPEPTPTAEPAVSAAPESTAMPIPAASDRPGPEILPFTDTAGVVIKNHTGQTVDIAALQTEALSQRLSADAPQILIVHTHGTEAYEPTAEDGYTPTDTYRTTDEEYNVIRVGAALAAALTERGFTVIHDRALYDYPSYSGSYGRSAAAVEGWLSRHPEIALVIDLHRDAVGNEEVMYKAVATLPEPTAQLMLVVGTGEIGLEHPHWRENLKLALAMQQAMDSRYPTLTRPIQLAGERYNQHLTTGSLILEVGTCGNSLSEAIRAAELFARAVTPLLTSLVETG